MKKGVVISTDTATLNVNARLCKSNPVQEALSTALDDVQRGLGLNAEPVKSGKGRRVRAKDFVDGKLASNAIAAEEDDDEDREMHSEHEGDAESDHSDDAGDGLPIALDDNIALSEDDDVDSEQMRRIANSESSGGDSPHLPRNGYSVEADLSISGSESEPRSESPEPRKAASATTKSSYLPSLTMAGYISGSDSDVPDDVDLAPKKNRRGQRARQQIWEKKYGTKANHLQKPDGTVRWDSKRGAVDGNSRGRPYRNKQPDPEHALAGSSAASKSRGDIQTPRKKPIDRNAPIHPSWEAAKKAKEKMEKPVAFQGKKVTFD